MNNNTPYLDLQYLHFTSISVTLDEKIDILEISKYFYIPGITPLALTPERKI